MTRSRTATRKLLARFVKLLLLGIGVHPLAMTVACLSQASAKGGGGVVISERRDRLRRRPSQTTGAGGSQVPPGGSGG